MSPHRPEPDRDSAPDATGVAHEHLTPDPSDDADWDEERMRAAKPREIRLDPDGSRHIDSQSEQSEPEEGAPKEP